MIWFLAAVGFFLLVIVLFLIVVTITSKRISEKDAIFPTSKEKEIKVENETKRKTAKDLINKKSSDLIGMSDEELEKSVNSDCDD